MKFVTGQRHNSACQDVVKMVGEKSHKHVYLFILVAISLLSIHAIPHFETDYISYIEFEQRLFLKGYRLLSPYVGMTKRVLIECITCGITRTTLAYNIKDSCQDHIMKNKITKSANYVDVIGEEKSRQQANMLISQAISHLHVFEQKAEPLRELVRYLTAQANE